MVDKIRLATRQPSDYPAVLGRAGGDSMSIAPVDWSDAAACRGSEGALFFSPDVSERKEERHEREFLAKRLCANCPVRADCLEAALARHETYGIWGGLNELERRALLKT
jgi:WhiB family redox-sensing transcriptional regulator